MYLTAGLIRLHIICMFVVYSLIIYELKSFVTRFFQQLLTLLVIVPLHSYIKYSLKVLLFNSMSYFLIQYHITQAIITSYFIGITNKIYINCPFYLYFNYDKKHVQKLVNDF